ncbi:hypothetical protein HYALB_00007367 [Hymenoscyphus albidus]|uniref:Uncharacterized protein n=1 Tax=Hymenoscyphus albidus TaxID=595503 RepID=A0A9N9Q3W0_9HELO|nr:hypothetical protein HYALB_00007367 [Hymenoscyphus albidus]
MAALPADASAPIPMGSIQGQPVTPNLVGVGTPFQAWNPATDTTFHLCDGDILTPRLGTAIPIVTNKKCTLDRQGRNRKERLEWRKLSAEGGNTQTRTRISRYIFNNTNPSPNRPYLRNGLQPWFPLPNAAPAFQPPKYNVNIVPGGANATFDVAVVVNFEDYYPRNVQAGWSGERNQEFRLCIRRIMRALHRPGQMPPGTAATPVAQPNWWPAGAPPMSVAFNLIGSSRALGFGHYNSAEQIMGAVISWLGGNAARRIFFNDVFFLIPTIRACNQSAREKTFDAWKKAWEHYITNTPPPPPPAIPQNIPLNFLATINQSNTAFPNLTPLWVTAREDMLDPAQVIEDAVPINTFVETAFGARTRSRYLE